MTNLLCQPKVFPNNFHVWCGRSNRSKNIFRASFRVQQLFKSIQPYYYSISTLMLFFALVDSRPLAQYYRIENSLEFFLNCALCIHITRVAIILWTFKYLTSSLTKWQRDSPIVVVIYKKSMVGFEGLWTHNNFEIFFGPEVNFENDLKIHFFSQFAYYESVWQVQIGFG